MNEMTRREEALFLEQMRDVLPSIPLSSDSNVQRPDDDGEEEEAPFMEELVVQYLDTIRKLRDGLRDIGIGEEEHRVQLIVTFFESM